MNGIRPSTARDRAIDWIVLLAGVAALYVTLPTVRRVQFAIEKAGGSMYLAVAPMIVIAAVLVIALSWILVIKADRRPMTLLLLANLGIVYFLMLSSLADIPVERMHLIEYGGIAYLAYRCTRHYLPKWPAYGTAALIVFDVGFIDEAIQYLLPTRVYDTRDVVTNAMAGLLGLITVMTLERPMPGGEDNVNPHPNG